MLVNVSEFKDYVGSTGAALDGLYYLALESAEREVLNFCHRSTAWTGFEQSTGLTRYYRPEDIIDLPYGSQYPVGSRSRSMKSWDRWPDTGGGNAHTVLWLGDADLLSVDSLTNGDGASISSTSYWLEPRNGQRFRYIRLRSNAQWIFNTDGEVSIAGAWGYSTAPDAVIVGCVKETAKYLIDLRLTGTADITAMPDLGQLVIPKGMPKHVEVALRKGGYMRTLGCY